MTQGIHVRAMHIQTRLVQFCARNTPFDFKQGYSGDFLIDAMWLAEQKPGTVRWIVVRDLGTHMSETLEKAKDHGKDYGPRHAIVRVEINENPADLGLKLC